jgi:hypothetical protein
LSITLNRIVWPARCALLLVLAGTVAAGYVLGDAVFAPIAYLGAGYLTTILMLLSFQRCALTTLAIAAPAAILVAWAVGTSDDDVWSLIAALAGVVGAIVPSGLHAWRLIARGEEHMGFEEILTLKRRRASAAPSFRNRKSSHPLRPEPLLLLADRSASGVNPG